MAWSASKIFRPFIASALGNLAAFDLANDTVKCAAFDNTITPSQDVTAANSAYGAGVWASGGVSDTGFPATGVALTSQSLNSASAGTVFFDAADTASSGAVTLANVYGVLHYDDTLATPTADPGICFNYLGGANSVTGGTFTVVYNASGIFTLTL